MLPSAATGTTQANAAGTGTVTTESSSTSTGIHVVQTARATTSSPSSTISVTLGSKPASGDLLVAAVAYTNSSSWLTAPSGWTLIADKSINNVGQTTFYHVAAAGEPGSYTWTVHASAGTSPMTVSVQEVAGVNGSSPIAAHAETAAATGYSTTTGTASASGALPLAFFAQYNNGNTASYYNGTSGWTGIYTVEFAALNTLAQEATYGPASSASVSANENWQGGDNSSQVSELILVAPGSSGGGSSAATAAPASTSAPSTTSASSSGPAHVRTMAYYSGAGENTGIPASYMAAHVDWIEIGANTSYANSFRSAGGTYALAYTDPNLIAGCPVPQPNSPGTCSGAMGNTSPESAWLHGPDSTRLYDSSTGQDELDPASSYTQSAYRSYAESLISGSSVNALVEDNVDPLYDASLFEYRFNETPVEITSQSNPAAYWLSGVEALTAAAPEPVIYNGEGEAQTPAMLTAKNVLGQMLENCVTSTSYRVNLTEGNPAQAWLPDLNALLQATQAGRYAVCLNYSVSGGNTVGDRLYALASWWLTYDPNYSVAFPNFTTPDTAGGAPSVLFAEYGIVPEQPLKTATSSVASLQAAGGAYYREFAACYQNGTLIGHCAAVVNPSQSATVSMPSLSQSYANSLTLDTHSLYNGGEAVWTGSIPSSLPAETGVILH